MTLNGGSNMPGILNESFQITKCCPSLLYKNIELHNRTNILNSRFKMETVDDVLDGLENGVQHALQAGIDRVNQSAKTLSHEIKDWRIMQQPFTYSVSLFIYIVA